MGGRFLTHSAWAFYLFECDTACYRQPRRIPNTIDQAAHTMELADFLEEKPADDSVATQDLDHEVDQQLDHDLEHQFEAEIVPTGPCCDKCDEPLTATESPVCQKCGWYASIGAFVEIDKSWEVAANPELATEQEVEPTEPTKFPLWVWILSACVAGVFIESLAVRLLTDADGSVRTIWSVSQLFVGFIAFGICHTYSFVLSLKNEADVKMLDYILRPIKTWSIIFRDLPERSWACYLGMSGITAVAMSLLVIGAIPYERLLDWGIEEKTKSNLLAAVMTQAQNMAAQEEMSMEEALGEFAGKGGVDGQLKKPAEKPRQTEDCIIIGYMANQAGVIQTLLIGAEHRSKLKYAGSVRVSDLSDAEREELTDQLLAIRTRKSFVRVSIDGASWVKPKYVCRISYRRRGKQGGLYGAKLEDMLGEVELGGN